MRQTTPLAKFSSRATPRRLRRPRERRSQRGFTLTELLVSLGVMVGVLLGVLALFELNAKVARVQMNLADMQQSLRISQYQLVRNVRMAGRGSLPLVQFPNLPYPGRLLPAGIAIAVQNNVPANTELGNPPCTCARVLQGTDVLTIRGVFNSPIYQINPAGKAFQLDSPGEGTLLLTNFSPTGVPQDLQPVKNAILNAQGGDPEAFILLSPVDEALYAVVEINGTSTFTPATGPPESATVNFTIQGGTHTSAYLGLSPGGAFPPGLATVAYAGLLEEYRFYVREEYSILGDTTSELMPRLSRARVYPGSEVAYLGNNNLRADLADNIIDLQIALGVDTDGDQVITEDNPPSLADDWLFNSSADNPADVAKWNGTAAAPSRLFYVRITTLGRTHRPDSRYQAPLLTLLEDKDYSLPPFDVYNSPEQRMYRRRVLQAVVDLRNIS